MFLYRKTLWVCVGILALYAPALVYGSGLSCDSHDECQCPDSFTILKKFVCDGENDCRDGSDELNCGKRPCVDTEHRCSDGRCILKTWRCDNYPDCSDGGDESANICNETCGANQFKCDNGVCIAGGLRCDKDRDCLEGEDERNCTYPKNCSRGNFRCTNSKCLDVAFVCDGEDDCGDNSDEKGCGNTCKSGSFTCKSGKCIPENLKCNGLYDCPYGSDEVSCPTASPPPTCKSDQFLCDGACQPNFLRCDGDQFCDDGSDERSCDTITCSFIVEDLCDDKKKCIMRYKFCDGKQDCADGSDENASRCQQSNTTVAPSTEFVCLADEYRCKTVSKCIAKRRVCDDNFDCPKKDDESSCKVNECKRNNGNCSQLCNDTISGFYCSCKNGYRLMSDSKRCQDINECEEIGKCSQVCFNTEGSYKCSCTPGYVLSPSGNTCLAIRGGKERLLVASGVDVRSITHDGSLSKCLVGKNTKKVIAVDMHHERKTIFWADGYKNKIFSVLLNDSKNLAQVVISSSDLRDLAIDWITGMIYWLKSSTKGSRISVALLDGSNKKSIYITRESLHSIVLDPIRGYLYWSSPYVPTISRAYMDGQQMEVIVKARLSFPTGLTVDFPNKKLIWLDSKLLHIESSDLDGNKRRLVVPRDLRHPFDVAVFGDRVYWSDSVSKTVSSANKFSGKDKKILISGENLTSFVPKGISVQHYLSQPQANNPCEKNGCSHLCLLIPAGSNCACPDDGILLPDRKNCKMPPKPTTATVSSSAQPPSVPQSIDVSTTLPPSSTRKSSVTEVIDTSASQSTKPAVEGRSNSTSSSVSLPLIIGVIAGILFVLLVVIAVVWCRRRKNTRKMEIRYSSKAENVKVLAHEMDEDDEDADSTGEQQPALKTFQRGEDEKRLMAEMV